MNRPTDLAAPMAAAVVVLTAVLGGGFFPLPRMVVGCALIAVWVVGAMNARGGLDRTEWLFAALMGWGLCSAIWVGSSPLASKEALTIWITAFALFGISRRGSAESRRRAVAGLTAGAAVIAAGVVAEALGAGLRVGGFLENPNVAAGILVPTLPVGWGVLEGRSRWRWIWVLLVGTGVVCTGSRAGLLAAVVAVGLLLPRGRLRLAGLLTASAMAAVVVAWRFISQPDVLAWHRISIWWAVLKIWLTRPLTGVGPGSLVEAASAERILHPNEIGRYQFVIGYSESTPLAVLVQLGLVGLVLGCLAGVSWWTVSRRSGSQSTQVVASLAAVGVLALFHDFLTIDPVLWWWAVLVGCAGPLSFNPAHGRPTNRSDVTRWSVAAVVVWTTSWGMISPAYARWVWQHSNPTSEQVVRTLRIEPWLSAAPVERVRWLLASPKPWSWQQAAEAAHWARVARNTRPGLASRWADLGRVHIQILTDLGGTDHDVSAARTSLERACLLDPHLPWNWLERARLARVTGDLDLAMRMIHRALEEEPNTVRGWQYLAHLEIERGGIEAACAAASEARERARLADRKGLNDYERELVRLEPHHEISRICPE